MKEIITLTLLVLITGCTATSNNTYEIKINKNVAELCNVMHLSQPIDIQLILKPYGDYLTSHTLERINKHNPNAKDYIKTFTYSAGEVVIYSVPHINRNYLHTIIISDKYWPTHIKNYIGTKETSLNRIFGKAESKNKNRISYACSFEGSDYIEFKINNGIVTGIKIQSWID